MIGITRIYGQQCQIYFTDAQAFWSRLSLAHANKPSTAETNVHNTKAPKETITFEAGDQLSMDNEMLLSGVLEDLLMATPEVLRHSARMNTSLTPGTRLPSLSLGARSGNTSSSAQGGIIPFEADDHYIEEMGMADLVPLNDDFDLGEHVGGLGSFLHGLNSPLPKMGDDPLDIPSATGKKPKKTPGPRKGRLRTITFDQETVLERDQLLLGKDEGLVPKLNDLMFVLPSLDIFADSVSADGHRPSLAPTIEQGRRDTFHSGISADGYFPDDLPIQGRSSALRSRISNVGSEQLFAGVMDDDGSTESRTGTSSSAFQPTFQLTQGSPSHLSDSAFVSKDHLNILNKLTERGSPATMENLLVKGTKREASGLFYQILGMATRGQIRVEQLIPFGSIKISLPNH